VTAWLASQSRSRTSPAGTEFPNDDLPGR
jgi:hypothetical protein